MPRDSLRLGGFVPFSTVDYPGQLSAVLFCQGCPWRCRYCHNPHLQEFSTGDISWSEVQSFLERRVGLLNAVVFSGGEPTAQRGLEPAMRWVRSLGFRVGLHTAGIYPGRLRHILPLVDWVGLDIKAPLDGRYDAITRGRASWRAANSALHEVIAEGVDYEVRTTVHPALLDEAALDEIQNSLLHAGARASRWQTFRPEGCTDEELMKFESVS